MSSTPLFDRYDEAPGKPAALEAAFRDFHDENPHIYREIVRMARQAREAGFNRYSVRTIVGVLRFRWEVETKRLDQFKINDHHSPYYARLIMAQEPDLAGFFELRSTAGEATE